MESTERAGFYSVGLNVFLVCLKLGLAAASGSLALAADAIHSLVDVLASLIVLVGLFIARRKSRSFPYGLYKVENVVSVVLSLLIFLAGYEIAREAWTQPQRQLGNIPLTLGGVALAMLVTFLFSRYERALSARTGSPSLDADSRHFSIDVLSSGVVFVAVLGSALGLPLDRIGAVVVVAFIVWAGWGLLVDGMRVLLDASLDRDTLDEVRRVIMSDRGVAELRSLTGRNSGRYRFLEVELTLRTHDLDKAHQISTRIEQAIQQSIPRVDKVLVHYEPQRKDVRRCALPLQSPQGLLSPHFGQAPYFAFVDLRTDNGQIINREVLANPYQSVEKQKGLRVAEFLIEHGVDSVVVAESLEGKGPSYAFADAGIEVRRVPSLAEGEVLTEEQALRELCSPSAD